MLRGFCTHREPPMPRYVLLAALTTLTFSSAAHAEVDFDQLLAETGIEQGETPIRETARWQEPVVVVVRGYSDYVAGIREAVPGLELIAVSSRAEAIKSAPRADAIIGICTPEIVSAATRASWIQIFSAGAERCLAADEIASGEIMLTNMQKMSSPVIGEHAIAMMMALSKGLPQFAKNMPAGNWDRDGAGSANIGPIEGQTMLVVGLGGIGREVARRAHALGMRVTATRNSSREGPDYVDYVGLSDELYKLASQADVIVNALPLTAETEGVFDLDFFKAVKEGALFISVGRGRSTVTTDLMSALDSGRLRGAGLDVTDPEPLPADHPLWQYPNVMITPHVAASGGGGERHNALLLENLKRFVAGDALYNVVDPAAGY